MMKLPIADCQLKTEQAHEVTCRASANWNLSGDAKRNWQLAIGNRQFHSSFILHPSLNRVVAPSLDQCAQRVPLDRALQEWIQSVRTGSLPLITTAAMKRNLRTMLPAA